MNSSLVSVVCLFAFSSQCHHALVERSCIAFVLSYNEDLSAMIEDNKSSSLVSGHEMMIYKYSTLFTALEVCGEAFTIHVQYFRHPLKASPGKGRVSLHQQHVGEGVCMKTFPSIFS